MNIKLAWLWIPSQIGPVHLISLSQVLLTPAGPNQQEGCVSGSMIRWTPLELNSGLNLHLPTGGRCFLQSPFQLWGLLHLWQRERRSVPTVDHLVHAHVGFTDKTVLFSPFQGHFYRGRCSTSRFSLWTHGSAVARKATDICSFLTYLVSLAFNG